MPIYTYRCAGCIAVFDKIQPISAPRTMPVQSANSTWPSASLPCRAGFAFAGSGWTGRADAAVQSRRRTPVAEHVRGL